MLTQPATPELVAAWKKTWAEQHGRLAPNRKSGAEVLAHLAAGYPLRETRDEAHLGVVRDSVLANGFLREKLPAGAEPLPRAFFVANEGAGAALYAHQDEVFRGIDIFVGIDCASGFVHVEGSSRLFDELVAFQGLDERDIENYFLVAQYVDCLERMGAQK